MIQKKQPAHEDPEDTDAAELRPDEIEWIRDQRRKHEHEVWLRGQVRLLWPWFVATVSALVALAAWVKEHVRL